MTPVHLTVATSHYDHVRELGSAGGGPEGIDLVHLELPVEEIFHRFAHFREWDVSEFSMAKFASLVSQGDTSLVGIPVFPSRVFRQSSIYVRNDGSVSEPKDLAGAKVGVPEWAQTAAVYSRAWLTKQVGIPLDEIEWFQAGVNEPGRADKTKARLPEGVRYTPVLDRSLTEMLLAGDLDAVLSAHPPLPFERGEATIVQLVADHRTVEEDYFRATGIYPIMHTIVIQRSVVERDPWIPMSLFKGFERARDASIERALDFTASRFPVPWIATRARDSLEFFGELFPYGIEPNRPTLEAFLDAAHEQGVCHRPVPVEELFAETTATRYRV